MRLLALLVSLSVVVGGVTWTYWRIKNRPARIERLERDLGLLFQEERDD